ncbi:MAG: hypothetical protein ACYS76_09745 [Planctomycetota bacterium]|jgi:hypothetical protein
MKKLLLLLIIVCFPLFDFFPQSLSQSNWERDIIIEYLNEKKFVLKINLFISRVVVKIYKIIESENENTIKLFLDEAKTRYGILVDRYVPGNYFAVDSPLLFDLIFFSGGEGDYDLQIFHLGCDEKIYKIDKRELYVKVIKRYNKNGNLTWVFYSIKHDYMERYLFELMRE